ncbi:hypothetical protein MCJ35_00635 [Enterocloster sp. OA13]|uniref:hypothetical protein n=1 Tax=Enterocloster sp. OA13 TaxID=2914161 RepID=UPI0012DCEFC9|nr:hypothetical protein [Enterocloster sp. OA13]
MSRVFDISPLIPASYLTGRYTGLFIKNWETMEYMEDKDRNIVKIPPEKTGPPDQTWACGISPHTGFKGSSRKQ